ncbi:MAG: hypothetical protein H0W31_00130 [Actinobacteria bacterium]|nr:hypothetical protein [Actinomycetota bacterium]
MTSTEVVAERMSSEERARILELEVSSQVRKGWRVVSQTQTQAQLVKGKPTNHILHLILSIITVGAWLIVWILVALLAGEKQKHLSVNEWGGISRS